MSERKFLFDMLDVCRGNMPAEEAFEAIASIGVCFALKPKEFKALAEMAGTSMLPEILKLTDDIQNAEPLLKGCTQSIESLSLTVLAGIVYKYIEVKNLALFRLAFITELMKVQGKKSGEFSSSQYIVKLLEALVGNAKGKTLLDAACGLGYTTLEINSSHKRLQDISLNTASLCRKLMLMAGEDEQITCGNSLNQANSDIGKFDLVVMTPPMHTKISKPEFESWHKPYLVVDNSFPVSGSDALWIQLAAYHLNEIGKAYLLCPQGVMFRGGYDSELRDYLLDNEWVEAVIALPSGSLTFTGIEPVILVLNKAKQKGSPIRFADIRDLGAKDRAGIELSEADISEVLTRINGDNEVLGKTKDVSLRQIRMAQTNMRGNILNVAHYLFQACSDELPNLGEQLQKLTLAERNFESKQTALKIALSID